MVSRPSGRQAEKITPAMIEHLQTLGQSWELYKPILRPLSSMTEEDLIEIYKLDIDGQNAKFDSDVADNRYMRNCAMLQLKEYEAIRFMLSKGFDLFGLIDSGLAVNAETLK